MGGLSPILPAALAFPTTEFSARRFTAHSKNLPDHRAETVIIQTKQPIMISRIGLSGYMPINNDSIADRSIRRNIDISSAQHNSRSSEIDTESPSGEQRLFAEHASKEQNT
jgi:hypothetical protein